MQTKTTPPLHENLVRDAFPHPLIHAGAALPTRTARRLPIGAEVLASGGVHFRVWAPRCRTVEVALASAELSKLQAEGNGYFSGTIAAAGAGMLYRYRLDGRDPLLPDPASRFQPEGPHGPSQ